MRRSSDPRPRRARRERIHRPEQLCAPPGSLVADPRAAASEVQVIAYGPDRFIEERAATPEVARGLTSEFPVVWINVVGLGDAGLIGRLGELFGLHPLALEDAINVHQRAKTEDYAEHVFIVTRMASLGERLSTEQLAIFLGRNFIITLIEDPGDVFDAVRGRIRQHRGQLRDCGPDRLVHALIDAVVDCYFPILEMYGERLEALEERVLAAPAPALAVRIHDVKRDLLALRRALWPQRDAIAALCREECALIGREARVYLRDCLDHSLRLLELLDMDREICSDLVSLHLSGISNRMNEIMKVLTIISTIFMPLSFIAGVYGMNFNPQASALNMPELNWSWGYPFALGLMAAVAAGLVWVFARRGWFGAAVREDDRRP